jgi:DNA-binding NarL/FixJ family response regulator
LQPEDHKITVAIADDESRVRRVVAALLAEEADIEVVGEAEDGRQALEVVQERVPDLVLLDIRMPVVDGLEAARRIHHEVPNTKVVMLTASDDDNDVFEALKAGASGYLVKDRLLDDLPGAVRVVARGLGLLLSPVIAGKLISEFRHGGRPANTSASLTDRELEVLRLVSLGYANHEIADALCLSSHTVKRHVANILAKLHQRSRLDAVMHAIREGVLSEAQ